MRIRIGYVAIALNLPHVTSSSTVTYTRYQKMFSQEERINKLKQVTLSNLDDLYKILGYNLEKNIHFYRITSRLVPLATHPEVLDWEYRKYFQKDFERIGKMVRQHQMRVDTHPDQFDVLNSTQAHVFENTIRDLWYHVHTFEDMSYPEGKMVLHIGSSQGGKEAAIERFIEGFRQTPKDISSRLILENDDKTFTAEEVLHICKITGAPMVLDIHHDLCNPGNKAIDSMINEIFSTWDGQPLPPKIHISSPREGGRDRKHADYVRVSDFIHFVEICRSYNRDMDVMIEAKQKDLALFRLVEDIRKEKPEWNWVDETTLEI